MPLKKGSSRSTVSKNITTLVHDYERSGSIGNSKPASKKKAVKQAVAIALDKARESRGDGRSSRGEKKIGIAKKSTARTSTSKNLS